MQLPDRSTPSEAVRRIPPGAAIVASPGCGTPETLLTHLAASADLLGRPTLYSGLQLGAYPFLEAAAEGLLRYRTWHPYGPARAALAPGRVDYVPARGSAVPGLLDQWQTSVALVRVSPPDRNGWCSLGPSASYVCHAVARATLVIAEVDPRTPRTTGDSMLHVSQISVLVDADTPPCEFPAAVRDETSDRVAAHVLGLLPPEPTLQLGIGAVPEAITAFLAESGVGPVRIVGMGNDAMVGLFERGLLRWTDTGDAPAISAAELMGTRTLMEFADGNPAIVLRDSRVAHAPRALARIPRLVAVNSAIEVDLAGQVGSELVRSRQVSGIGGSADFVEAGFGSDGGLSVIALPSTTPDGRHSRIVPRLGADVVSLARHTPDAVVTEYGVAWLRGRTEAERVEALVAVAHPDHRDGLLTPTEPQETR
ncbi:acetyl-CoA hydrolase/transferase C-terminal domain-containing protein [Nocardioides sp. LHD-245]|uniref:acetyl-CoA hydrolase/transferase family protein n=1 Tax=Nocardioides sp. LHD-245 TaxID=3051387 RepID=UPI0027E0DE3B|nr:acetyl-CoA hydrolase/transferase C-terminal domain-containing protein [Nocardioides sp. LHD-245]